MLPDTRRPSKIQGLVYMILGFGALSFGTFLLFVPIGLQSSYRYIFCGAVLLYGIFRALTGLGIVRRAMEEDNKRMVTLNGTPRDVSREIDGPTNGTRSEHDPMP